MPASEAAPVLRHPGVLRVLHLRPCLREMAFVAQRLLSIPRRLPRVRKVRSSHRPHPPPRLHFGRSADRSWLRTSESLESGASAARGHQFPLRLASTRVLLYCVVLRPRSLLLKASLPSSVALLPRSLLLPLLLPYSADRQPHSLLLRASLPFSVVLLPRRPRLLRPLIMAIHARRRRLILITILFEIPLLPLHRTTPSLSCRRNSTPKREAQLEWLALDAEASQRSLVRPCSRLLPYLARTSRWQGCLPHGFPCRRLPRV